MDDECVHGMDPSWCSLCLHPPRNQHAPVKLGPPFPASLAGQCPECDLPINPGQIICRAGERWVHTGCAP